MGNDINNNQQDEILIKEASGGFKVIAGGKLAQWEKADFKKQNAASSYSVQDAHSDLKNIMESVLKKAEVDLTSHVLRNRFINLIFSRLKDVRNKIELTESLKRPVEAGGIGLDKITANKVARITEAEVLKMEDNLNRSYKEKKELDLEINKLIKELDVSNFIKPKIRRLPTKKLEVTKTIPKPVDSGALPQKPMDYVKKQSEDLSEATSQKKAVEQEKKEEIDDSGDKKLAPDLKLDFDQPITLDDVIKEIESEFETSSIEPQKSRESAQEAEFPESSAVNAEEEKFGPEKVKIKAKLTGPVEEIRDMTLLDFRRLSSDPQQAVDIIYNKILFLEKDSFAKKSHAISGWRESEVFKKYMEIGRESIEKRQPIESIIADRKEAGEQTLTLPEFEAIMDMNEKIRF